MTRPLHLPLCPSFRVAALLAVVLLGACGGGSDATYRWDMGDGTIRTGATVGHTYKAVGSYTIALTVTNGLGVTGQKTAAITAHGVPVVDR